MFCQTGLIELLTLSCSESMKMSTLNSVRNVMTGYKDCSEGMYMYLVYTELNHKSKADTLVPTTPILPVSLREAGLSLLVQV